MRARGGAHRGTKAPKFDKVGRGDRSPWTDLGFKRFGLTRTPQGPFDGVPMALNLINPKPLNPKP